MGRIGVVNSALVSHHNCMLQHYSWVRDQLKWAFMIGQADGRIPFPEAQKKTATTQPTA